MAKPKRPSTPHKVPDAPVSAIAPERHPANAAKIYKFTQELKDIMRSPVTNDEIKDIELWISEQLKDLL